MLEISNDIYNLDESDLSDNLLHYRYDIKHLLSLQKRGVDQESGEYLSAYRSFEGEVYENFLYEKLVRYAARSKNITQFVIKGPHTKKTKAQARTLSVNAKGAIVYRTKQNEIGEFDGLMFIDNDLFFVEMTLVKSVTNLKRRLRKKRALLKTIFPQYNIKALIILVEGVMGAKHLPEYCTVWLTKPFSSAHILEYLKSKQKKELKKFDVISSDNFIGTDDLDIAQFSYYGSLMWMLKNLRAKRHHIINMNFLNSEIAVRYLELFTKVYLGWLEFSDFKLLVPNLDIAEVDKVFVSIEKEHTGALVLSYFLQHTRKKLDYVQINEEGEVKLQQKDPFGITVTEISHMSYNMKDIHKLNIKNIKVVTKIFKDHNAEL